MRIVLDTNVVISASLWRGKPYQFLTAIKRRNDVYLYSSTALLEELAGVLTRPAASRRLAAIGKTAHEVLIDYVEAIELTEPLSVPRVVANDAKDDEVIAAAIAASADWIVSGDRKHLLSLGNHQGIAIIEVAEAIRRIAELGPPKLPSANDR